MSLLSITVETEDPTALKACALMLAGLQDAIPEKKEATPSGTKPETSQPAADHTYDVDGRNYTADDIRSAGFTVEQLKRAGLSTPDIVQVLGVTAELVDATPVPDIGEEPVVILPPAADVKLLGGIPWDPRIHAGTKTTVANGTEWKKKKGVDKALVESVTAELLELMAIEPVAETEVTEPVVVPPPAETETPVVIPPPADGEGDDMHTMTFAEFLKACSAKMTAGETNMARILEVVNDKGVASLQLVNNRQDLIPELWAVIEQHQKVAQ